MRRWKARGIAKEHFVEWQGKAVTSVKTAFGTAVRLAKLPIEEGNVTPHTLRHTAATWLMQNGAPIWEAAGFLEMSERRCVMYGHHHPEHLRGAAVTMNRKQKRPGRSLVISLEKEKAKRHVPSQVLDILGGPGRTRTSNQTVMSGRL
jgi:integrase